MNKSIVTCVAIIAVAAVLCVRIYGTNNRYFTAKGSSGGPLYRIDRRTGETVLISGDREHPVEKVVPTPVKELVAFDQSHPLVWRAVQLAKEDKCLSGAEANNEREIFKFMQTFEVRPRAIGWETRAVAADTYLVTYSYDVGDGLLSYPFEVNLRTTAVACVIGDAQLEKKYGYEHGSVTLADGTIFVDDLGLFPQLSRSSGGSRRK